MACSLEPAAVIATNAVMSDHDQPHQDFSISSLAGVVTAQVLSSFTLLISANHDTQRVYSHSLCRAQSGAYQRHDPSTLP